MNTTSLRAAIYARISDDREGEEKGVSRQLEDCRARAETLGLEIAGTFVDNDISASTRSSKRRPAYAEMLERAKAGEFGTILAYSNSRLTRRPRELEDLIVLHERHGVSVRTVVSGDDDLGTADGRMVARIKASVDAAEAERTGERVARAQAQAAAAGFPAPAIGYGYRRVDGKVVVNREEAAIVREATRRLFAGETLRSIAADLNTRGIESPRRTKGARSWSGTTLRQMLRRESLAGLRRYRGEIVRGDDGQPVKGSWEPILTVDEHERLVALFNDPVRKAAYNGRTPVHLLSGIAKCGLCGGTMKRLPGRVTRGKAQPSAYACAACHKVRRKQETLDDVVTGLVIERLSRPDAIELFATGDPAEATAARDLIATLDARLSNAGDLFAEGSIDAAQLRRITEKIRREREGAERALAAALPPALPVEITSGNIAAAWDTWPMDTKRTIVKHLLEITVLPIGPGKGRVFDPSWIRVDWVSDPT